MRSRDMAGVNGRRPVILVVRTQPPCRTRHPQVTADGHAAAVASIPRRRNQRHSAPDAKQGRRPNAICEKIANADVHYVPGQSGPAPLASLASLQALERTIQGFVATPCNSARCSLRVRGSGNTSPGPFSPRSFVPGSGPAGRHQNKTGSAGGRSSATPDCSR